MTATRARGLAPLLLLGAGCPSSPPPAPPPDMVFMADLGLRHCATGQIDVGDALDSINKAVCARGVRCAFSTPAAVATCLTHDHLFDRDADPIFRERARALGTLAVDCASYEACLAFLTAGSCERPWDDPWAPECSTVYRGMVQNGGACAGDIECAEGYCKIDQSFWSDRLCGATCVPFIPVGGFCGWTTGVCGDPRRFLCGGSMCFARGAEGAPCKDRYGAADCVPGLACHEYTDTDWRCAPPLREGDPCVRDFDCRPFEICDWQCAPGLFCDHWETSRCRRFLDNGQPCHSWESCKSDFCDGLDWQGGRPGTCRALGDEGTPCTPSYAECKDGLYCDDDTRTCRRALVEGDACDPSYKPWHGPGCDYGLSCVDGRCRGRLFSGDPCVPNADDARCDTRLCDPISRRCAPSCPPDAFVPGRDMARIPGVD